MASSEDRRDDRAVMTDAGSAGPTRSGPVRHFTATGYVVNPARTRMLLIRHRALGLWLPPGGHLEADEIPHEAALREVLEETGITARLVPLLGPPAAAASVGVFELPQPWVMLHEDIPAFAREPAHVHLDLCYLLEARRWRPAASAARGGQLRRLVESSAGRYGTRCP